MSSLSLPSKGLVNPPLAVGSFLEKKVYLAQINDGLAGSVDVLFSILNPSVKLNLSLWFYWEPSTSPSVVPTAPTVAIDQTIVPPLSGTPETVVGTQLAATAIPLLTEINQSMSSRYRGTLSTGTLAAGNSGSWVMLARWEPAFLIDASELAGIFPRCDASLQGQLRVL